MPTFATPGPISVTLDLNIADVRLHAGDRADTVVTIAPRNPAESEDVELAERTRVEFADGRLGIRAPRSWRSLSPFRTGGALDVEIELPTGSEVRGEASIAEVQAAGELGACRFKTSVGDLTFDRTGPATLSTNGRVTVGRIGGPADINSAGAVRIGTTTGSTTIKNLNGATEVDTVEGDLTCRAANGDISVGTALGHVKATTSNGDVSVDEVVRGDISLETSHGRIEIGIRPGTAAQLDVHSRLGRVRNDLESADGPDRSDEIATVRARTSLGDVVIRRPESPAAR
jgi:putative adhesin